MALSCMTPEYCNASGARLQAAVNFEYIQWCASMTLRSFTRTSETRIHTLESYMSISSSNETLVEKKGARCKYPLEPPPELAG